MQALKLAFRTLLRTPFVTGIAIVSLALGIGANAGIYSVFNQMLLRPLPVNDPGALYNISLPGPKEGSNNCSMAGSCDVLFSNPMYRDLEKSQKSFTGIAAHTQFGANFAFGDRTSDGSGSMVSGSYFPVLGLKPAIGRLLNPADDGAPGGSYVAVLSYAFWQAQMGCDPGVLNQRITINGKPWTIVGVAPDGFEGTTIGQQAKVFVPIAMREQINPVLTGLSSRRNYWAYVFGRLKSGVTVEAAERELTAIAQPILRDVESPALPNLSESTRKQFLSKKIVLEDGSQGQSLLRKQAQRPLYMLFGVSAIVLLIACANIANLLLVRGANRSMEMSVRLALGASRRQLLAQLLTESLLLAAIGGIASLLVARWTLGSIASMLPVQTASSFNFELQPSVLAFAAVLAIGTGFLFGMFPALHSTRSDLVTSIRANAGQISGARAAARFRSSLVTVQIALSMALLTSAGLFLKSITNVNNVNLGADIENVVTFLITPQRSGYTPERAGLFFKQVEDEMRRMPGVTAVTSARVGFLSGNNSGTGVNVQGFKYDSDTDRGANYNEVGAGYFGAMKTRMIAGRDFAESDAQGGSRVVIVNEAFVKKFNLGHDAVGKYMSTGDSDSLTHQIIGVAQNSTYADTKEEIPPVFYTPWGQGPTRLGMNFYVRTTLPMDQTLRAIPQAIKRLDSSLPVRIKTLPQQMRDNIYIDLMISKLSATFALLATLLAGVGLYGVLAYTVAQRTREIGVRMALGADSKRVKVMVLKQVGRMMIVGGVVGLAGAVGLGQAAASMLYGLKGNDPVVFVAATGVLIAVAVLAGYLPARRASRVHPMQALRYE
ncbi:MAG: ABC transporter permease [Gemmatimonas sp.]